MNILHIIGNGLDISLGMKTDYQSFYDYYQSIETNDEVIAALKSSIKAGRYNTWADLEAGLGQYSKDVKAANEFTKCLDNIKQALNEYLQEQFSQKRYKRSRVLLDDMYHPEQYLDEQVLEKFRSFLNEIPLLSIDIKLVTLNYTNTIEDVFSMENRPIPPILHLHGSLQDGIVTGVNDIEQIANASFRANRDVTEDFVKPLFNDACLNNNNLLCKQWIDEADVIVLFGTSLGATDRKWWRLIGERLQSTEPVLIMYFVHDRNKNASLHPNHRLRWTEAYQQELLNKFEVKDSNAERALSRICVGINKPIFKMELDINVR